MTSFVAAYLIVWAFVALYVWRLRASNQRNLQRLETLERLAEDRLSEKESSRAA